MKTALRCLLAALSASLAGLACAQGGVVDTTPLSPAHSLSCLERPTDALKFPERDRLDRGHGMMRVQLRFDKPDAPPKVEVLANTAREDMQDLVYRRLAEYRLPCLTPEDGPVSAIQEFNFSNSDREPLPLDDVKRPPLCIVMPRHGIEGFSTLGREVEHVVLALIFNGDGQKPPEASVIYSTGSKALEQAAADYASEYRMPCRSAGDKPRLVRQQFVLRPAGAPMYAFKREGFGLGEFLGMTEGIQQLEAEFDFKTMHCPFKVDYEIFGPQLPNEVRTGGKRDPNRLAFLKWLSQRQIVFKNAKQAKDLFGTTLQINVPCGALSLHPEEAAAPVAAASAGG